jgi:hypothetical protein
MTQAPRVSATEPYRETVGQTLRRTLAIALVIGGVGAMMRGGGWRGWAILSLLALWPALGGHFFEVLFLNWLRPRVSPTRGVQIAARVVLWFAAGVLLILGMQATAVLVADATPRRPPPWWIGGLAFIGVELIAHLVLQLRGLPSFYNGRG